MAKAYKSFDVIEWTTADLWYCILVYGDRGLVVDEFLYPTMKAAKRAFEAAGYKWETQI